MGGRHQEAKESMRTASFETSLDVTRSQNHHGHFTERALCDQSCPCKKLRRLQG